MPLPDRAAPALAERYSLALERAPLRGTAGAHLGRASGSSLEFHDRRAYQSGDDPRHLDWRALARSDRLFVRLWREEVLARVEVLVDASRSIAVDPAKAGMVVDLAALLVECAREDGLRATLIEVGDAPRPIEHEELLRTGLAFRGSSSLVDVLDAAQSLRRRGSVCIVLSDFLFPHDPRALVNALALRAGTLALVQVLSSEERAPRVGGAQRLVDCETEESLDLVLDENTVAGYRARLERLREGLESECRRARARFASLDASHGLERVARDDLVPGGVLAPRGA